MNPIDSPLTQAWTDGSSLGNPGPAGAGIVLMQNDVRTEISEYLGCATNNVAELKAILRVLELVSADTPLRIHTDSQYSIGVLQKGWKYKANKELIASIRLLLSNRYNTQLVYTPGHAGVILNEQADLLARQAALTTSSSKHIYQKDAI